MSIDLVESRVLPVIRIQVDVEEFRCSNSDGAASRVQKVQGQSAYSEVRWRLIEVWGSHKRVD